MLSFEKNTKSFLQQIQKDVKAGELKLKLSEADLAKESELLQQIHILQSASLETLLPAEESK
jgi:flagellin-like hook-associated protein FlgL